MLWAQSSYPQRGEKNIWTWPLTLTDHWLTIIISLELLLALVDEHQSRVSFSFCLFLFLVLSFLPFYLCMLVIHNNYTHFMEIYMYSWSLFILNTHPLLLPVSQIFFPILKMFFLPLTFVFLPSNGAFDQMGGGKRASDYENTKPVLHLPRRWKIKWGFPILLMESGAYYFPYSSEFSVQGNFSINWSQNKHLRVPLIK